MFKIGTPVTVTVRGQAPVTGVLTGNDYANIYINSGGTPKFFSASDQIEALKGVDAVKALKDNLGYFYAYRARTGGYSGTDPEIFAFKANGDVLPAWEWLPDKDNKIALDEVGKGYWDGVQAEFSTDAPRSCHEELIGAARRAIHAMNRQLQVKHPGAVLRTADVVELTKHQLMMWPDEYLELGCSPSLNAYGDKQLFVADYREMPYRFSGCHTHHSDSRFIKELPKLFPNGTVMMMDRIGGLIMTAMGRDMENPIRRQYYGKPGEFRLPQGEEYPYIEYRVPGSFLLHHPMMFYLALDMNRAGFQMGLTMPPEIVDELKDAPEIIKNCDADAAYKLILANRQIFDQVLGTCYSTAAINSTYTAMKKGLKNFAGSDLIKNWITPHRWNTITNTF